ncbi:3-deoxy-D-manno-octulosonic acid transferase [Plastoroseomonas arctica]|uniref:3-deoxy-D-manno-octulosonic acid transferase n=1 Tax=Plastoroseomonas arctica TaxID=1509237 RepID=A0AAF1KRD5_9PROT|nr:3-deoxy-D-manno-octulosonic acid transferase [Plastoroseomonas arctica]MBR0654192.1 3-deoxy-D-manno-octulosonic acid transferase [Plastoroseomonas arctica]
MSLAQRLWHGVASLAAPVLPFYLRTRVGRGKEIAERLGERRGEGADRPPGPLLWLHAASVGETLSVLPLLPRLLEARPALHILMTTGTVTAATLLAQRLPPEIAARVRHRFVPLDVPAWVARFLDGWRPDAAAFVESEFWPNLLAAAASRHIPLALLNARISSRSARRWAKLPDLARETLQRFAMILAQSDADAARFTALGATAVTAPGNLKYAALPLPADDATLAELRAATAGRPILLAASTHPGEEAIIAEAHTLLRARFPDLLTILVPRHPERGAAIATSLALPTRRSTGGLPTPETGLYIADTLGELGLFYRLADLALIGGSLIPHGGQNPLEPARLACPILTGPHMDNFAAITDQLSEAHAIRRTTPDPAALAEAVAAMLSSPETRQAMAQAAAGVAAQQAELPDRVAATLLPLLDGSGANEGRVTVKT